ncbi:MAG TPA: NAD(P)H-dependent oxidoreductase subunit E [Anaerolineales bacterium]|nr:NAD(P)H-dependent oxidoreductase subunit E [Anaerolineales bacterium]
MADTLAPETPQATKDQLENRDIPKIVDAAIKKHGRGKDALIPIFSEINAALGYIPAQAITEVRRQVHDPANQVLVSDNKLFSMVSFYHMFSTKPRGRHVIKFCESAPCHVVGGRQVWQALCDELKIQNGETTPDNKWSLVTTSCLGICSVGPVILVDDDVYGNVTPADVAQILAKYD